MVRKNGAIRVRKRGVVRVRKEGWEFNEVGEHRVEMGKNRNLGN